MKSQLLNFLRLLESRIPPPPSCHHAILRAEHGNDHDGWNEKLALQVNYAGKFHCFFVDDSDLLDPEVSVAQIKDILLEADDAAQISDTPGRF